jgi:phage gpG-like protein
MAAPMIDVRVFGEVIIRRRLLRLASRMTDQREGFQDVVRVLREATAENFRTRGVSGGVRWPDHNEEYSAPTHP